MDWCVRLEGESGEGTLGFGHPCSGNLGFAALVVGVNEGQIGYAEKSEQHAQIRLLLVKGLRWGSLRVGSSTSRKDVDLLSWGQEGDDAFRGEVEGSPGAYDQVDPSLERGWHAEVPHRNAQRDDVCGDQFIDQLVGELELMLMLGGKLGLWGEESTHRQLIDKGKLLKRRVVMDHGPARVPLLPFGGEGGGELAGDGGGARAGVDVQQGGNGGSPESVESKGLWTIQAQSQTQSFDLLAIPP